MLKGVYRMAQTKKNNKKNYQRRTNGTRSNSRNSRSSEPMDSAIKSEIILIAFLALSVFVFLCNFGVGGVVGAAIRKILFGIFGLTEYIMPVVLFTMIAFGTVNSGNVIAIRKLIAGVALFLTIGMICELATGAPQAAESYQLKAIYEACSTNYNGGGVLAGTLAYFCYHFMGMVGTVLLLLVVSVISIVVLTEKSIVSSMKTGGRRVYERSREDAANRKERTQQRRLEIEEERKRRAEERENEHILRMDKKVTGVMLNTTLTEKEEISKTRDDIHEINLTDFEEQVEQAETEYEETTYEEAAYEETTYEEAVYEETITDTSFNNIRKNSAYLEDEVEAKEADKAQPHAPVARTPKKYIFPPISKLVKGPGKTGGDSSRELKQTALRLQQTLQTFGVRVSVTDISQGPSVTRFELQPEQGVKVSKIVGLSDDIKLNLAATDIRIEAPIPGKAAVGIEVPNKENMMVALRDLLESKEFKEFPSKLAFAVGKDISGKTVVADIAKMPHMLIAGATGSGKSVCINTLIMSIIYKAHPDDVKMIMIDPKVVELSVYNGIPHLLIPVVTDPKKASSALQWGVAEMTDRYQKFADYNVRDLKGYNKKVESMQEKGETDVPSKMPQIVIIVDELADLMMVCPGEVEESICRLAQLARAAGIHLIIATQRPSVDVITGLIKANMPSRVAFSVSSGVDSRTILDMNGAEKLLGKGDMLFYPQGYTKPARIQGAFVSDKEVADVVEFLKNQAIGNIYDADIQEKIATMKSGASGAGNGNEGTEYDAYFIDAAKFIIEKDKASIGMLQRVFKIGFNRAARIMDQLYEAGIVGEEEGTKPRKILMSLEQLEQYIDESF